MTMNFHGPVSVSLTVKIALAAAVLAAASGVAFAAWLDHGAAILMSMAQTGLAWCF
jgi:hypothetical protein